MNNQKPSVGRIVHYIQLCQTEQGQELKHLAAIITDVQEVDGAGRPTYHVVSLCVIGVFEARFIETAYRDDTCSRVNTWHFPERV